MTGILSVVIVIAIVGVVVWAIQTYVPMPPIFKGLITVVIIIAVLLWLLDSFGGAHIFSGPGRLR
jgi:hypothetical protein